MSTYTDTNKALSTAAQGAAAGASIGTAIYPGIGTAAGALVGGFAGFIVGNQPIPQAEFTINSQDIYGRLSSQAQYSSAEEATQMMVESEMIITDPDEDAKTRDFNNIMQAGSALANIYSVSKRGINGEDVNPGDLGFTGDPEKDGLVFDDRYNDEFM